jgi:hypothetical protein
VAKTAAVSSRYSDSSLRGVIQDIHLLSLSNYLVCTFSSQVILGGQNIHLLSLSNYLVCTFSSQVR